jgi:hypothetical protein
VKQVILSACFSIFSFITVIFSADVAIADPMLTSKAARQQWEDVFSVQIVQTSIQVPHLIFGIQNT